MSTSRKIAARLRTLPTDYLLRLPGLYRDDAQALALLQTEIKRRQQMLGITPKAPTA